MPEQPGLSSSYSAYQQAGLQNRHEAQRQELQRQELQRQELQRQELTSSLSNAHQPQRQDVSSQRAQPSSRTPSLQQQQPDMRMSGYLSHQPSQPGSSQTLNDLRASYSSIGNLRASQAPPPSQPGSQTRMHLPGGEEDERARIEQLQGVVDKQKVQLHRRNEELLDLQRNHVCVCIVCVCVCVSVCVRVCVCVCVCVCV